ncbi:hypothetical protein TOPH_08100 [Tolypocladium ophioglossoides CBS 100239]|uniref:Uncharacterized protein n=1 Tax=Tolypocladium ophioglossoides (strain CBS 100239) TaxID=1163406 RepID=A0A0L0MZM1_TOLOC|nr:hypothetical protein TOPH_08100 [Tolypocladium ophioglossoides CBS 100239]
MSLAPPKPQPSHTYRPVLVSGIAAIRAFWQLNRQIRHTNGHPDNAWRTAAQCVAQQLRANSTTPPPLHLLPLQHPLSL